MLKTTLALIVKADDAEAKKLDRCLASCASEFDEVVITITGENKACEDVANKYNAKISHFDWINDFAKARNFNFAQATGDWIVWLDADDVLRNAENIRKNVEMANENKFTGLSIMYNYAHDKAGKVTQQHWKLQIVKKGFYEWKGIIHENLIGNGICQEASINDVVRVHTATEKDSELSLKRNIEILKMALELEPEEPRHYFYSARCYLGLEDWQGVIKVIERYLELSGWKQERYEALNMMGEAYMRLGDYTSALKVHTAATLELEDAPDAYIYKARNYIHLEKWTEALTNLQIAELRDKDAVNLKHNALYDHDLYVMSAVCLLQLGMFSEAKVAAERAYKNRHSDHSKEILDLANEMAFDENLTQNYLAIAKTMLGDKDKLQLLVNSMPEQLQNDPRILSVRFAAFPSKKWKEGSVAIFCGNSADSWTGEVIKNGGIGGSETAVIYIAEELAKKGKEVVVYNRCDAPTNGLLVNKVLYRNFWEFNRLDEFDVLWAWRMPSLADYDIKARKFIVDVHDVMNPESFSPERLEKIDHVFVKTEYHKTLFPTVPEEKFVVIGNGIDLSRFQEKTKKEPARIIYTSTANRGLESILNWWPDIKKAVPQAELHVFYGWNTFYELNKENPERMAWMESMKLMMEQDGIVQHGRVDQITLAKEMLMSSIWLYPTEFPEIHCITALEMQAAKVYPITSGYAALAETQQSGVKIPVENKEKYVAEIVNAVENPDLLKKDLQNGLDYVKSCSWELVTNKWESILWN
jgi:tetratricopeptide (TPR) repeat protein